MRTEQKAGTLLCFFSDQRGMAKLLLLRQVEEVNDTRESVSFVSLEVRVKLWYKNERFPTYINFAAGSKKIIISCGPHQFTPNVHQ